MEIVASFRHQHYENTINSYLDAGYFVGSFKEYLEQKPLGKTLILRHDVDNSLECAIKIAQIEHKCGVNSSYFIRVHSSGYNPFSLRNYRIIRQLIGFGHEIGLHIEPSMPYVLDEDAIEFCERSKNALEAITGQPLIGMSSHEPVRMGNPKLVDELSEKWGLKYHAYEKRFFKDMKYISDSGARWREGCFSTWINKADNLQVATHPFWWYAEVSQENY